MAALGLTSGGPWLAGPDAAAGCHSGVLSTHIPRHGRPLQYPRARERKPRSLKGLGADTKQLSGGPGYPVFEVSVLPETVPPMLPSPSASL